MNSRSFSVILTISELLLISFGLPQLRRLQCDSVFRVSLSPQSRSLLVFTFATVSRSPGLHHRYSLHSVTRDMAGSSASSLGESRFRRSRRAQGRVEVVISTTERPIPPLRVVSITPITPLMGRIIERPTEGFPPGERVNSARSALSILSRRGPYRILSLWAPLLSGMHQFFSEQ